MIVNLKMKKNSITTGPGASYTEHSTGAQRFLVRPPLRLVSFSSRWPPLLALLPPSALPSTLVMNCSILLEKAFSEIENACGAGAGTGDFDCNSGDGSGSSCICICDGGSGKTSRMTWLLVSATDVSILRTGRSEAGDDAHDDDDRDGGDSNCPDIFSMSEVLVTLRILLCVCENIAALI